MQCVLIKYFSFSVISYLVAAAGILLLFNQSLVMGILTVAIGISIRPQIASSLIVLVLPFLIYEILKNKKWKEMLILVGIVFSIHVSNKVYSMTRSDVQEYLFLCFSSYLVLHFRLISIRTLQAFFGINLKGLLFHSF